MLSHMTPDTNLNCLKGCTRKSQTTRDAERGLNYFALDDIDGSKKETTVLVNEGFDDQDEADTPVRRKAMRK